MAIELPLVLAIAALVLAAWALLRAYKPPQTRQVLQLAADVADLQTGVDALASRLTKRSQKENMDRARDAHEERARRRDQIETEAVAVLAAAKAAASPPAQDDLLSGDEQAARRALRAKHLQ